MSHQPAKTRNPTIADVAQLAGVSTATVSRTLNEPDRVRANTRQAVEKAVAQLGYTPNFAGQVLASSRSNTIGAIIPTMENAIFARAVQALQESLAAHGITLLVATSLYSTCHEEAQIRTLLARGVDGMVLIGSARPDSVYDELTRRQIPFVILWSNPDTTPYLTIGFDNAATAGELAHKVLACGHRRIGVISGITRDNDRASERLQGIRATLDAARIALPPDHVVERTYSLIDGAEAARILLSRDPRPTVLICGNDVLAAGALRGARLAGYSVPGDVSVVGFDDIELATAVHPPLTTMRVPQRRMGAAAADCLVQWLKSGKRPASVALPTMLVERESLAPAPSHPKP